jgi:hypothetical protein
MYPVETWLSIMQLLNRFAKLAPEPDDLVEVGVVSKGARDPLDPRIPVSLRWRIPLEFRQLVLDNR